jgi:dTDP-4-dehydrorhamnose reductase
VRILVTGAAGQLGRALPAALREHDVTALPRAALDIADGEAVRAALAASTPQVVINAAAWNDVDRAESEPEQAFRANVLGPRTLAEATAARGIALVHVSTDYVFDGAASAPYVESSPTRPLSVYGRSKCSGEQAVIGTNPRHFVVRTAWLYALEGRNFPNTLRRLAESGPVRVVDDQRGSPTYVPHLATALAALVPSGAFGIHHAAGQGDASWYELTRALFQGLGLDVPVEPVATDAFPRPAARPRYSVLGTERRPAHLLPPWQEGLAEYVRAVKVAA